MATKIVKEIVQEVGGKTTVEYSDDSTSSFNIADTVTAVTNPLTGGIVFLADGREYPLVQVSPRSFGAVGDGVADDTLAWQTVLDSGCAISCDATSQYKITATLVLRGGDNLIFANGAKFLPTFGAAYSTPLFSNNKATDASTTLKLFDARIVGNCVGIDMRFTANNPGAGLKVMADRIYFQTNDGNRRPGTSMIVADQIDFMSLSNLDIWNCDLAFQIGSAPPRRNCTQIYLNQVAMAQVNSAGYICGVDKMLGQNIDTMGCNSGYSFEGNNTRIKMLNVHVEAIAKSGYSAASSRVAAAAAGYGYYFAPTAQNSDITIENSSVIDTGNTGGTANGGVYVGRCDYANVQSIHIINCKIPTTMEGSANYKPIVNRGKFCWTGAFPYSVEPSLSANGFGFLNMQIEDTTNLPGTSQNLLPGNSVYPLLLDSSITDPPTITQTSEEYVKRAGWTVVFNANNYELFKIVNLPQGWITIDVTGFKISGNPILFAQQNGAPFTDRMKIQFNGLNDAERRWRISFWNDTPNMSHKVGFSCQNSGDSFHISNIAMYRGFSRAEPPESSFEVVKALPPADARWVGKGCAVRASGVADAFYRCLNNSSNTPTWIAA